MPTTAAATTTQGATSIVAQDIVGSSLPLIVTGETATQHMGSNTWGRLVRLENTGTPKSYWDLGIDQAGNLFFNCNDKRALTIPAPNQAGNVGE
jgi:hypothetical protein